MKIERRCYDTRHSIRPSDRIGAAGLDGSKCTLKSASHVGHGLECHHLGRLSLPLGALACAVAPPLGEKLASFLGTGGVVETTESAPEIGRMRARLPLSRFPW
jgi:hypothetical protein